MNMWGKWVLWCCICLLIVCAIGTVALAGENQGTDEIKKLTQRVEDIEQQEDELNTKIDNMDIDYLSDEFNKLKDDLLKWVNIVLVATGSALLVATFWGTVFLPRQADNALKRRIENAQALLAKTQEDLGMAKKKIEKQKEDFGKATEALAKFSIGLTRIQDRKYEDSMAHFEAAVSLAPDMYAAWDMWGNVLQYHYAPNQSKATKVQAYEDACKKYKTATEQKPEFPTGWFNWGSVLNKLARIKKDDILFKEAFEKYKKAIEYKSDYYQAWCNWGASLNNYAKIK